MKRREFDWPHYVKRPTLQQTAASVLVRYWGLEELERSLAEFVRGKGAMPDRRQRPQQED